MKPFMNEDFLLKTETAKKLYEMGKDLPIIDYHCHINPQEIYENRKFNDITEVWLGGDHYKWRLIRSNGVPEEEITGSADNRTKFQRFAEALPKAIGNPMYHWTHLELKRYFGYDGVLNGDTAEEVWNLCNEKLKSDDFTVRRLIERSNVAFIGTTDDPADSLEWHKLLKEDESFKTVVAPSFRPDKAVNIEKDGFKEYIAKLSEVVGEKIDSVKTLKRIMHDRLDLFEEMGCKAADHGLDYVVYAPADEKTVEKIFKKAIKGNAVTSAEMEIYKTDLLIFFAEEYHKRGWAMQIHYGTMRNINAPIFRKMGPDVGFDVISNRCCCDAIAGLLNAFVENEACPKIILYSLNPADNQLLDTIIGAFQGTEVAGKIQHGSAWWFNDTKTGMQEQMTSLANLSILGNFVGMLTDSRSFLSYTRHEYFRRILCNLLGDWVENGEYPYDEKALQEIVQGICYYNAKNYFGL